MNPRPHTHWCAKCARAVACSFTGGIGCLFPATSAMTCEACEDAQFPDLGQVRFPQKGRQS